MVACIFTKRTFFIITNKIKVVAQKIGKSNNSHK